MHFAVIFRECTALFCSVLDAADHRHAHVGASAAAQIAQQHISAYLHAVIAGGPGRIAAVAGASLLVPHPAALQLTEKYYGLGYDVEDCPPPAGYKDYNEWLVAAKTDLIGSQKVEHLSENGSKKWSTF